jgi:proteasome maturation protein
MKLEMEQAILSQFQRLPGLKSSMVGLDTLMNRDEDIDAGDYLGSTSHVV